jgi:imidazolonepropionase
MAVTLITNIKQLAGVRNESRLLHGNELAQLPVIDNAYLLIEEGLIADYGPMTELQTSKLKPRINIDATGQFILPAWCDSHTHLVFPASREAEFIDKIN